MKTDAQIKQDVVAELKWDAEIDETKMTGGILRQYEVMHVEAEAGRSARCRTAQPHDAILPALW